MFRHPTSLIVRAVRTGTRSYRDLSHVKPAHIDEAVVPSGSWQEAHQKNNTRYNMQLIIGIVSLIGTIAVGRMNGTLWLNYYPPEPKNS